MRLATSLLLLIFLVATTTQADDMAVNETTPPCNHTSVAPNMTLSVTFDRDVDFGTTSSASVRVYSELHGYLDCTHSQGSSARELIIDPEALFAAGDQVTVTVTRGVESTKGEALLPPYQWCFYVATAAGTGELAYDSSYWSWSTPSSLDAADLDGDLDIDLVTVNRDFGTVATYFNGGNGKFTSGPTYDAGTYANGIMTGDWDHDGDIDLVTNMDNADSVAIFDNDGSGVFTRIARLSPGDRPHMVDAVDVNGDGDLDILVAAEDDDFIALLQNTGGTFVVADSIGTNSMPTYVASGFLNDDHLVDLAVASYSDDTVDVLLNTGGGVFTHSESYPAGRNNWSVAVADLNGDLLADIVSAGWQDSLSFMFQVPGGFTSRIDALEGMPRHAELGDIDGDGDLDVIVACQLAKQVVILTNDGAGNFTRDTAYTFVVQFDEVCTADFNGDRLLDVAAISPPAAGLFILLAVNDDPSCCTIRGDVNHSGDPIIDISDLVAMVGYMYQGAEEPFCLEEADIDASGGPIDISDLVYLVSYMYQGGPVPIACP